MTCLGGPTVGVGPPVGGAPVDIGPKNETPEPMSLSEESRSNTSNSDRGQVSEASSPEEITPAPNLPKENKNEEIASESLPSDNEVQEEDLPPENEEDESSLVKNNEDGDSSNIELSPMVESNLTPRLSVTAKEFVPRTPTRRSWWPGSASRGTFQGFQETNVQESRSSTDKIDNTLSELESIIDNLDLSRRDRGQTESQPIPGPIQGNVQRLRQVWEGFSDYEGSTQYDLQKFVKAQCSRNPLPEGVTYKNIINDPEFLETIPQERRGTRQSSRLRKPPRQ
jgi:hypothetical protein